MTHRDPVLQLTRNGHYFFRADFEFRPRKSAGMNLVNVLHDLDEYNILYLVSHPIPMEMAM